MEGQMELALKGQLKEAIAKALDRQKEVKKVTQTGVDPILAPVRRRLRKAKVWKKIQTAILNEGFAKAVAAVKAARTLAEADVQQLRLPGMSQSTVTVAVSAMRL
jgi:tRNA A37 threonylcarbamoyladenosine dehydratase